jgi:hypothetical protein
VGAGTPGTSPTPITSANGQPDARDRPAILETGRAEPEQHRQSIRVSRSNPAPIACRKRCRIAGLLTNCRMHTPNVFRLSVAKCSIETSPAPASVDRSQTILARSLPSAPVTYIRSKCLLFDTLCKNPSFPSFALRNRLAHSRIRPSVRLSARLPVTSQRTVKTVLPYYCQ